MKIFVKQTVILLVFLTLNIAQTIAWAKPFDLRVMTYNIYGVPCFDTDDFMNKAIAMYYGRDCPNDNWYTRNMTKRVRFIADSIRNMQRKPDVVLFQEAHTADSGIMNDRAIRELAQRAGYPYFTWGPASKIKTLQDFIKFRGINTTLTERGTVSSGLLILSRFPIEKSATQEFDVCRDVDCGANTGIQYVRLKLPNTSLDVFNTHLQAFMPHEDVRIQQIGILQTFMKRHHVSGPAVLGGDFNLRMNEQYRSDDVLMKSLSGMSHSVLSCKDNTGCQFTKEVNEDYRNGLSLDHLFHSSGRQLQPIRVMVKDWQFENRSVSDHKAVVVDYRLAR